LASRPQAGVVTIPKYLKKTISPFSSRIIAQNHRNKKSHQLDGFEFATLFLQFNL
jgi:hypothetical protein